jgi:hypothetical protein
MNPPWIVFLACPAAFQMCDHGKKIRRNHKRYKRHRIDCGSFPLS